MRRILIFVLGVLLCAGCSYLKMREKQGITHYLPTKVTAAGTQVLLTDSRPAANCQFKGSISGDMNPDVENRFLSLVELTPDMQADLRNNAAQLGGNTVWVRGVDWHDTEESVDYPTAFVVNNVQYGAQVYWCPDK